MQSMFDERLWLAWVAKVRIIILTLLFGIELAIARLTPSSIPLRLFINVVLLWYTISIFYLLLLSFWEERRIQALLQVVTDLALVTLVVYATGGVAFGDVKEHWNLFDGGLAGVEPLRVDALPEGNNAVIADYGMLELCCRS